MTSRNRSQMSMLSLCALLGNVEITVCPGEVTSTQELRAVSSLGMHSPECTVQQTQGIQLFIRTA